MVTDVLFDHLFLFLLILKVRLPIAGHTHTVQRRELAIVNRRLVRLIIQIAVVVIILMLGSAFICEAIRALVLAIIELLHATTLLLEVIARAKLLTIALFVACRAFPTPITTCQLLHSVIL